MTVKDFAAWAVPDLELPLRGRTYSVRPPSVEAASKCIAAAVLGEVNMGLVQGPVPDEIMAIIDGIGPDEHPALGDVHDQLVADGVDPETIQRMTVYAVFYWARGEQYADFIAHLQWDKHVREQAAKEASARPKAGRSSRPRTGPRTA